MPVRVVTEVHGDAVGRTALDGDADPVGLVPEDHFERIDTGLSRGLERSEDERLTEKRLKQLRLTRAVLEPITIACGKHKSVPGGDGPS
jgi:hypothetical protein